MVGLSQGLGKGLTAGSMLPQPHSQPWGLVLTPKLSQHRLKGLTVGLSVDAYAHNT
jgi:hypothetical protein